VGNTICGLYSADNSTVDATNNWWGSNNPKIVSSGFGDISITGGIVTYNPWLVLNMTADPESVSNNSSTITADLTHNSNDDDTSSQGHVPDNIPVDFATTMGTVNSTVFTRNGKANATFNRGTSTSGTANITATVDNQTVQTNVTIDTIAPTVTANTTGGVYNTTQVINLTATDNLDPNPVIYYTLDGSDPTTSSTIYMGPITLQMDNTTRTITVLKFIAVDWLGNIAQVQNEPYVLTLPVVDINNSKCYSTIQGAINDVNFKW